MNDDHLQPDHLEPEHIDTQHTATAHAAPEQARAEQVEPVRAGPVQAGAEQQLADSPVPPKTGDPDIDAVLREVAAAQTGGLADRIAAGEHAQDALQSRLRDLGGA